jgi:hypothetical protein
MKKTAVITQSKHSTYDKTSSICNEIIAENHE